MYVHACSSCCCLTTPKTRSCVTAVITYTGIGDIGRGKETGATTPPQKTHRRLRAHGIKPYRRKDSMTLVFANIRTLTILRSSSFQPTNLCGIVVRVHMDKA